MADVERAAAPEAEAEVRALAEQLRAIDADGDREVRRALGILADLIRELPATDSFLIGRTALEAWRVLRDRDPESYLAYLGVVRQQARSLLPLLENLVGPPRRTPARPIEVLSPAELCARPAPLQSIRGVLPAAGIGVAYGDPGSGKSVVVLDMAMALARGVRWRGRRARQGAVIWIAAEGSTKPRLEAYAKHHAVELREVPIRFVEQPLSLRGADSELQALLERLRSAREALGPVALTVVDTLNRTLGGGNESASEDMGEYIAALDAIGEAIGGLVLVIHHSGKEIARGPRGHSSMRAAADVELEVTRDASGVRSLRVSKMRDGEDGLEFPFRLEVVDLGPHPDPDAEEGERLTSVVAVPSDEPASARQKSKPLPASAQVALEALRSAIELHGEPLPRTSTIPGVARGVRLETWQAAYESVRPIEAGLQPADARRARHARRMAFMRAMDQLQASGVAGTAEGYWWLRQR